ncbi:tyrosine-protein kinase Dnt-like [Anoplophora glabripennis]|uniref:tyrosine-protein kinase Dnt-like n=1 Tax=Anoplophora glabripennis TaxID=217634 RepID=UPI0008744814|nr:tyrosine-protein kinase Dnt-like [Anoplophora glabripennis]
MGINAELFYVHKGVVNTYALNFVVMIPSHINEIQFSWQSLMNYSLPYVIAVKYGHGGRGALHPPEMNISSTGVIPTYVQTFSIKLMCTGLKNAEIKVEIHLHVSTHKHRNATMLKFRRNKICLKGIGNSRNDSIRLESGSFGAATGSLYVAVACALAMITLVVVTTSAVCIKKKARAQEPTYMTALYDSNPHMFLRSALGRPPSAESGSYATIASVHKGPPSPSPYATSDACQFYATSDACRVSYYASSQIMLISQVSLQDPRLVNPAKRLRSLSVLRQTISLDRIAEEGIFGKVYQGTYRQQTVIIKTTKEAASKRLVGLFLAEGTMMYGMEHKNVLTILCANLDDPKQPLLVYPYSNRGNLKRYLIKCRQKRDNLVLSTQNLVDIAIQILLGIMYLHSQNVCYKDAAVRNAVIDEKLQVKITDNSLSRDMFPNDYFCLADQESKPVKWMALESLIYNQYSAESDVWSFGVVLWELTTMAQQPFPDVDPFEMSTYLRNGFRLGQPLGCPDELFAVMTYCWLNCPTERPQMNQLLAYLQDFYTALCRFV